MIIDSAQLARRGALGAAVWALVLTGCAAPAGTTAPGIPGSTVPLSQGLPSEHVHGVAINPQDERVYLATHDGLFRYDDTGPVRIGPQIDLMGFTVAGPDHFYASGHPGPGVEMANPVGLIQSTDAGESWSPLSREEQSDFHTLTASQDGVTGYDGTTLLTTTDGVQWTALKPPVTPFALATSPDGTTLLATSQTGLARSTDSGAQWSLDPEAPLLQLAYFVEDQVVVGIAPTGTVHLSTDAGASWTARGTVGEAPQAVTARRAPDGELEVLVVTATALVRSLDGGRTFTP